MLCRSVVHPFSALSSPVVVSDRAVWRMPEKRCGRRPKGYARRQTHRRPNHVFRWLRSFLRCALGLVRVRVLMRRLPIKECDRFRPINVPIFAGGKMFGPHVIDRPLWRACDGGDDRLHIETRHSKCAPLTRAGNTKNTRKMRIFLMSANGLPAERDASGNPEYVRLSCVVCVLLGPFGGRSQEDVGQWQRSL